MGYQTPTINEKNTVTEILLDMIRSVIWGSAKATSSTPTEVDYNAASQMALAVNTNRKSAVIVNTSAGDLYVKYGATAANDSYTYLVPADATLIIDDYTGRIDVLFTAAGVIQVSENV
jgi:hypothetical protein